MALLNFHFLFQKYRVGCWLASESSVTGVEPMILHCAGRKMQLPHKSPIAGRSFLSPTVNIYPCAHNNNKSHFVPAERELKGRISYTVRLYTKAIISEAERNWAALFLCALCVKYGNSSCAPLDSYGISISRIIISFFLRAPCLASSLIFPSLSFLGECRF